MTPPYLKIILDSIFDIRNFRNEITWQRAGAKNDPNRYGRGHDVILFYTKSDKFTWNKLYTPFEDASIAKNYTHVEEGTGRRYRRGDLTAAKPGGDVDFEWYGIRPYTGRHWAYSRENLDRMYADGRIEFRSTGMPVYKRYLDEQPGVPLQDVWTDIRLTSASKERLGYPTQKPVALLERILQASSNPGDVVLDPFCGCGTTVDAAVRLDRRWVGIDVTYIAIDLIKKRLLHAHGPDVEETFVVEGIPRDLHAAQALFEQSAFEFERWAVSLVGGQPNEKQVGDKGVDGIATFPTDAKKAIGKIVISVKGGKNLGPQFVRDLLGTVETRKAQMGVLVTMGLPTKGMLDAANHSGTYLHPATGHVFPRVQTTSVAHLLRGHKPEMPLTYLPYMVASPALQAATQMTAF
ncbi:DNA methyltransferase [Frankia tisae]|uniref:DNA methyltransferase n=1 Tax=Frankia tisae TaxID=2950104 RepID=UPI0021BF80BA|nr:DNA methyltransferase [Frankia tisae]